MICYNTNNSVRNNQAISKEYLAILYWMGGVLEGYNDPDDIPTDKIFTENRKNILVTVLKYIGIFPFTYISHETIAKQSGVHHDTVYRTIKLFVELGILKKKYRGANKTCLYSIGSFLHCPQVLWGLREVLPNLYWSWKSSVSKCKKMLSSTIGSIVNSFTTVTARLSKDKNKYINTDQKINFRPKRGEFVYEIYNKHKESEEKKDPTYMERMNKLAIADTRLQLSTTDQVTECMKETNLARRIELLKATIHTVHRASKPYIEFLIRKYTKKMQDQNESNSW